MNNIKRIAINTGGGDAQELNAVIHATVHAARNRGCEMRRRETRMPCLSFLWLNRLSSARCGTTGRRAVQSYSPSPARTKSGVCFTAGE
jgi:hypothetical protein